jgi:hypothetical protein
MFCDEFTNGGTAPARARVMMRGLPAHRRYAVAGNPIIATADTIDIA